MSEDKKKGSGSDSESSNKDRVDSYSILADRSSRPFVLIIEDSHGEQESWRKVFKHMAAEYDVRFMDKIPDDILSVAQTVLHAEESGQADGFIILDNHGVGNADITVGLRVYQALGLLGYQDQVAMSSSDALAGLFNLRKPSAALDGGPVGTFFKFALAAFLARSNNIFASGPRSQFYNDPYKVDEDWIERQLENDLSIKIAHEGFGDVF